MARQSTFAARESLLRELKEQQATVRDRPAKIAALTKQVEMAKAANFPQSAIDALNVELQRVQKLGVDETLSSKIDTLARWLTVEKEFQQLFGKPVKKATVAKSGDTPKRRGRPPKGK